MTVTTNEKHPDDKQAHDVCIILYPSVLELSQLLHIVFCSDHYQLLYSCKAYGSETEESFELELPDMYI